MLNDCNDQVDKTRVKNATVPPLVYSGVTAEG